MTRRRKIIIFWLSVAMLILGVFLFLVLRPSPLYKTTVTEPDQEAIDEVIDQVESMDEEVQTATNDLSETLKDAVEKTINVFTQNDYHVTAIGDSLTQGVGDETNRDGYLSILKRRLSSLDYRVRIENFGRRGYQTHQLIEVIETENLIQRSIRRADIILLTVGANDILQIVRDNLLNLEEPVFDAEIDDYEERLIELIEVIRSYNQEAALYLIGFYNPFEGYFDDIGALEDILIEWNDTGEAVFGAEPNGHFIPIHDLFWLDDINLLADDNFHPNETGYSLMGARVFQAILPAIEELSAEDAAQDLDEQTSDE